IGILERLYHFVERVVLYVAVRRLRRIEHGVEHVIDILADAPTQEQTAAEVSHLMQNLGVTRYRLYARDPRGQFALLIDHLPGASVQPVAMSPYLQSMFRHERSFVDFQVVPYEW